MVSFGLILKSLGGFGWGWFAVGNSVLKYRHYGITLPKLHPIDIGAAKAPMRSQDGLKINVAIVAR